MTENDCEDQLEPIEISSPTSSTAIQQQQKSVETPRRVYTAHAQVDTRMLIKSTTKAFQCQYKTKMKNQSTQTEYPIRCVDCGDEL